MQTILRQREIEAAEASKREAGGEAAEQKPAKKRSESDVTALASGAKHRG